ncbi:unnamed protein product [Dicrocoelium dendriticum]|nr:unnamed protein product [Dicrocoelium dendriticum]
MLSFTFSLVFLLSVVSLTCWCAVAPDSNTGHSASSSWNPKHGNDQDMNAHLVKRQVVYDVAKNKVSNRREKKNADNGEVRQDGSHTRICGNYRGACLPGGHGGYRG